MLGTLCAAEWLCLKPITTRVWIRKKDLEAHASEFAGHDMVRHFITREAPPETVVMGLPEDVRDLNLDRDFPPESTAQIVDADSSQLRAIAAISRGYPLVLEGPPGTGKSQTITNMLAQALAPGWTSGASRSHRRRCARRRGSPGACRHRCRPRARRRAR